MKNDYPDNKGIDKTREILKIFNHRSSEEITKINLKCNVVFLADVFEKFVKVSIEDFDINLLDCGSFPGYIWQCGMKKSYIGLQTL